MLTLWIRRIAILSILLYLFFSRTDYTDADMFAERVVAHNTFSGLTLSFSIGSSANNNPTTKLFQLSDLQSGGFDLGALRVNVGAGSEFNYQLRAIRLGGDEAFCDSLQLKVTDRNLVELYAGTLANLSLSAVSTDVALRELVFIVSLDEQNEALKNKDCEFNLSFKTYRDNPDETGGINAWQLIHNSISSGS